MVEGEGGSGVCVGEAEAGAADGGTIEGKKSEDDEGEGEGDVDVDADVDEGEADMAAVGSRDEADDGVGEADTSSPEAAVAHSTSSSTK